MRTAASYRVAVNNGEEVLGVALAPQAREVLLAAQVVAGEGTATVTLEGSITSEDWEELVEVEATGALELSEPVLIGLPHYRVVVASEDEVDLAVVVTGLP
jgi:hypothetical protein